MTIETTKDKAAEVNRTERNPICSILLAAHCFSALGRMAASGAEAALDPITNLPITPETPASQKINQEFKRDLGRTIELAFLASELRKLPNGVTNQARPPIEPGLSADFIPAQPRYSKDLPLPMRSSDPTFAARLAPFNTPLDASGKIALVPNDSSWVAGVVCLGVVADQLGRLQDQLPQKEIFGLPRTTSKQIFHRVLEEHIATFSFGDLHKSAMLNRVGVLFDQQYSVYSEMYSLKSMGAVARNYHNLSSTQSINTETDGTKLGAVVARCDELFEANVRQVFAENFSPAFISSATLKQMGSLATPLGSLPIDLK